MHEAKPHERLDENKSSVFYELGIAHSTQPLSKQVLMASSNYISKSDFDTKDLIHFRYHRDNLSGDIDNFARWIKNSLEKYKIEQENRVKKAKMRLGHEEFIIMRQFGKNRNFVSSANDPTRNLRHELGVVSTNILPGLSYEVLPKKMHSISPVFLVVSTVFYWLSQF